jgi:hypothetical protein
MQARPTVITVFLGMATLLYLLDGCVQTRAGMAPRIVDALSMVEGHAYRFDLYSHFVTRDVYVLWARYCQHSPNEITFGEHVETSSPAQKIETGPRLDDEELAERRVS